MLESQLKQLIRGESLAEDDMADAMGAIMDGHASAAQIAGLLIALRMKGETVDEITGAARAMRQRMSRIDVARRPLMDTCGTGGDDAGTFNISTTVAFVVAAAGIAVAKHGNRAVSSRSGSADVLAALGVNISASFDVVRACIEDIGIGFIFAPSAHPAMRHAAAVRKELGVRTMFNLLGPLTNPAGATHQLMGVFAPQFIKPIAQVLGNLGSQRAWVVHGADGLDELTLCDTTRIAEWDGARVVEHTIVPEDVGLVRATRESLKGGDAKENAGILREVLAGTRPGPVSDAVALNAGAALFVAGAATDFKMGVERASDIIKSGAAMGVLNKLVAKTA